METSLDTQFASIWQEALDQYAETNGKRLEAVDIAKLHTVQNLKTEIDARHKEFSEFTGSRRVLFETLSMALKPIEFISNMAAGAASLVRTLNIIVKNSSVNAATGISSKLLRLWFGHVSSRCVQGRECRLRLYP
jgi:hypothetical protein